MNPPGGTCRLREPFYRRGSSRIRSQSEKLNNFSPLHPCCSRPRKSPLSTPQFYYATFSAPFQTQGSIARSPIVLLLNSWSRKDNGQTSGAGTACTSGKESPAERG